MQADMTGRTVIVTGAARGIGLSIAQTFGAAGANVVLTDILTDRGEDAARSIRAKGEAALFIRQDVREDAAWAATVGATVQHFGGLDFLINNAGVETAALVTEFELSDLQHVFSINVFGAMLGTKYALRAMRPGGVAGKGGVIVNIASAAAIQHAPGLAVYGASKAAIAHFTRSTAVEAGAFDHGVRVNCIMPGLVDTDMTTQLSQHFTSLGLAPSEDDVRREILKNVPLKRIALASEIASVAKFLCSDAATYMTGACLAVDGGSSVM